MKKYAIIKDNKRTWAEDFNVSSEDKAKIEIQEYVNIFNESLKPGGIKRELVSMPIKNKKVLLFADPMNPIKEELDNLKTKLINRCILFDKIKGVDIPPFRKENYDILFFDWGGMSMGNSLMDHFCREIIEEAKDYPNRTYVMVSMFTKQGMEDALYEFGEDIKLHNIHLDIDSFAKQWKEFENIDKK